MVLFLILLAVLSAALFCMVTLNSEMYPNLTFKETCIIAAAAFIVLIISLVGSGVMYSNSNVQSKYEKYLAAECLPTGHSEVQSVTYHTTKPPSSYEAATIVYQYQCKDHIMYLPIPDYRDEM